MTSLGASRAGRRILVVEDNLDSVHTLALLLTDMGHEVEYAINGYAALSVAHSFRPDIVLLDLGLPGLDGFEVCRIMKNDEALRAARVIAVTGYADEDSRRRSRDAGCELHVVKPVSPQFLESLLRAA